MAEFTPITIARFWSKVDVRMPRNDRESCWPWRASTDKDGYGQFKIGKSPRSAHRLAWQIVNGDVPPGQHVLHDCDNPICCNPAHLFLGTHADNMKDRQQKGRYLAGLPRGSTL